MMQRWAGSATGPEVIREALRPAGESGLLQLVPTPGGGFVHRLQGEVVGDGQGVTLGS